MITLDVRTSEPARPIARRALGEAGTHFTTLLDQSPVVKDLQIDQASQFGARGMFGLSKAIQAPPSKVSSARPIRTATVSPAPASPSGVPVSKQDRTIPPSSAPANAHSQVSATAGEVAGTAGGRGASTARPITAQPGEGAASLTPRQLKLSRYGEVERPAALEPRAVTRATPAPAALILSGPEEALRIVVRAGDQIGLDRTEIRRRAQALAADFGMSIADFRLDGKDVPTSHASFLGEHHGRRTR